jgi:hypothetical protein
VVFSSWMIFSFATNKLSNICFLCILCAPFVSFKAYWHCLIKIFICYKLLLNLHSLCFLCATFVSFEHINIAFKCDFLSKFVKFLFWFPMLLASFMDMAPLRLLPNLKFHLHFFASIMPNTLTTTTPIDLPSSSIGYLSFLSSSMSPKILYALKGKSAII